MKIDTEKIKNKKFTGPIEAKLQKYSQEYRALATLKYLFPNRFKKWLRKNPLIYKIKKTV